MSTEVSIMVSLIRLRSLNAKVSVGTSKRANATAVRPGTSTIPKDPRVKIVTPTKYPIEVTSKIDRLPIMQQSPFHVKADRRQQVYACTQLATRVFLRSSACNS